MLSFFQLRTSIPQMSPRRAKNSPLTLKSRPQGGHPGFPSTLKVESFWYLWTLPRFTWDPRIDITSFGQCSNKQQYIFLHLLVCLLPPCFICLSGTPVKQLVCRKAVPRIAKRVDHYNHQFYIISFYLSRLLSIYQHLVNTKTTIKITHTEL